MVKHLVMWRIRRRSDAEDPGELQGQILRTVDSMRQGIDGLRFLEVGFNRRHAADAADLALYSEFDTWDALVAYEAHPLHGELKDLIGPLRAERRVVDYEI
jgi:hypothetical protein